MNPLHYLAIFFAGLSLAVFGIAEFTRRDDAKREAAAWQIVCDASGTYSFTYSGGILSSVDYPTLEEARIAMAKAKEWHRNYDVLKAAREKAEQEAEKQRAARFKPCK